MKRNKQKQTGSEYKVTYSESQQETKYITYNQIVAAYTVTYEWEQALNGLASSQERSVNTFDFLVNSIGRPQTAAMLPLLGLTCRKLFFLTVSYKYRLERKAPGTL